MANSIEIIISGGFVGIQQNEHTLKVCIPIGYLTASAIQKLSDQDKIDLLFNLQIMIRKIYQKLSSYQKIRFRDDDDSEISQIQLIDQFTELQKIKKLIDHFDSFDLMHLQFWKTQNDQINFDHLHLMFDQGVILKNNAVFWEYQSSEQKRYLYGETALVKLYCFLLKQMITLLGSDFCLFDDLKKDVLSISQYSALFVDEFLNSSDQFYLDSDEVIFDIFSEDSYQNFSLMNKLRSILTEIDRNTHVKNRKYDLYFDTIDFFLNGGSVQGEKIWGIEKFSFVWEHIAFSYFRSEAFRVLFNDLDSRVSWDEDRGKINNLLKISLDEVEKKRDLYPDLLFGYQGIDRKNDAVLVDFKYVNDGFFDKSNQKDDKFRNDLSKQILYQIALTSKTGYSINRNFFIYPCFVEQGEKVAHFGDHRRVFIRDEMVFYQGKKSPVGKIGMDFRDAMAIFLDEYLDVVEKVGELEVERLDRVNETFRIDARECNNVKFNMVFCPSGEFWMGTDDASLKAKYWNRSKPKHKVKMNKGFWMGETQVTQELWEAVMGWNPSHFKGSSKLPVERVTWYDSLVFCNKLSELEKFTPCFNLTNIEKDGDSIKKANVEWLRNANGYRLPTEAEWEYSAKAGTELIYSGSNSVDEVAWYYENAGNTRLKDSEWDYDKISSNQNKTHEVKGKKANAWSLYDMSGNVWEWCMDQWDENAYKSRKNGIENPLLWSNFPCARVARGGSYWDNADDCRVAFRRWFGAVNRYDSLGFRLLRCEL